MPAATKLVVLTVLGGFTIRFKVAMFFAAIICTPAHHLGDHGLLPACAQAQRAQVGRPDGRGPGRLFFLGMVFCYFVILPAAFGWLIEQIDDFARFIAERRGLPQHLMLLEIGFGIAFELPLVIFYLSHPAPRAVQDDSAPSGATSTWASWCSPASSRPTPRPSPCCSCSPRSWPLRDRAGIARYVIVARDGKEGPQVDTRGLRGARARASE
jgi:sec-independent protein translocase protein TatC